MSCRRRSSIARLRWVIPGGYGRMRCFLTLPLPLRAEERAHVVEGDAVMVSTDHVTHSGSCSIYHTSIAYR